MNLKDESAAWYRNSVSDMMCAVLVSGLISTCAFAGEITYHDVPSESAGTPIKTAVYQPDLPAPPQGWPVIYLLHGLGGSEKSWSELGHIQATLDGLIMRHAIAPVVVVMPDAKNSWYVNSYQGLGTDNYETALTQDLPIWVEQTLPVRKDAGGRAIAGVSMGGYGALRFALLYPEKYVVAASLSAAIWQNVPAGDLDKSPQDIKLLSDTTYFHFPDAMTLEIGPDLPPPGKHFEGAFGSPFDPRFFNARNVFTMLEAKLSAGVKLPALFLTVGDDDSHLLWRGSFAFYETMQAKQREVELRVTDGDHVWSLWRDSIVDALVYIDGKFSAAQNAITQP